MQYCVLFACVILLYTDYELVRKKNMAVTIQQIAERAGVSRGTVDRALNNRGRINPEVAEMVKKTAEEMGYVHKARKRQKKNG